MQTDELNQRLSRINTEWTMLLGAHAGDAVSEAQWAVLQRYQRAIYCYLLGAVRDADAAEELTQEFALRFLRGAFRRADPSRGRFRNYLKTALVHLVTDYHRARQNAPGPLAPDVADPIAPGPNAEDDEAFIANWRAELLERTWQALLDFNPAYHGALKLRTENPDMSSAEMATTLTTRLGKPISAALVRKSLQRAHEKFADLLLDEVAQSIESEDRVEIERELTDLDLLKYCRSALERR